MFCALLKTIDINTLRADHVRPTPSLEDRFLPSLSSFFIYNLLFIGEDYVFFVSTVRILNTKH